MKVLVLGGTQFIGRHVVRKLHGVGYTLTLLNRGKTAPGLFPEHHQILADRESEAFLSLPALKEDWDAVVDLSAYYPKSLGRLLRLMNGRVGRYVLCSTLSAYVSSAVGGPTLIISETDPLRPCTEAEAIDTTMASYGQRKAECERVAMQESAKGLPVIILRPCVVFGEHDHTDRLAYWIWRASRKEPFILPDAGLTITRRTYAPDLASAFVAALKIPRAIGQAYNVAETDPLSFRDTLYWLGVHLKSNPLDHAVSVSSDWLTEQNVRAWVDLPLWIPKTNLLVDTFKARSELDVLGTPAAQALSEAADAFLRQGRSPAAGLSMQAEVELLMKVPKLS